MRVLKIIRLALLVFPLWCPFFCAAQENKEHAAVVVVFFSPTCHECAKVKNEVFPSIKEQFKNKVVFEYRDITSLEHYQSLVALKERYGVTGKTRMPVLFLNGKFLSGEAEVKSGLVGLIGQALGNAGTVSFPEAVGKDLIARFKGFNPLAVMSAGLIDGINPCAFAVIIFFISFLALQGYRKFDLIVIGLFFVVSVFCAYLLIGLGLFNFLYTLKGFWLVTKIINIAIGVFCCILGVLAALDFLKYKATGKTEAMALQLPQSLKSRIHALIGAQYRKEKHLPQVKGKGSFLKIALSAFVTGFSVSILEAVCTGQVYLPTITFILKTTHLKAQALGYLILYNCMFVVPLLCVFMLALLGVSSQQLSAAFKRHFSTIKIVMSILFFSFGFYLIWRS